MHIGCRGHRTMISLSARAATWCISLRCAKFKAPSASRSDANFGALRSLMSASVQSVAQRRFSLADGREVRVSIGLPERPAESSSSFRCPYQISGIGSGKEKYAWGEDSIQALISALQAAGAELYSSNEWRAGNLDWDLASIKGDLGMIVPNTIAHIPPVPV